MTLDEGHYYVNNNNNNNTTDSTSAPQIQRSIGLLDFVRVTNYCIVLYCICIAPWSPKIQRRKRLRFVAITYGKVSLWLWKSLENAEYIFFSPTLWPVPSCYSAPAHPLGGLQGGDGREGKGGREKGVEGKRTAWKKSGYGPVHVVSTCS